MTSRCGWLLLGIAVGVQCVPGCFPLRVRPDGTDSIGQISSAPADVAVGKHPPTEEPAIAKAGESAYPSVLDDPPQPPPTPMLEGPKPAEIPDPRDLVAQTQPDSPPATAETKPPAEPPIKLAPFVQALQDILDDRHQDALKHLQAYDPETQEFYLRVLPTLTILARKRVDQLTVPEVAVLNDQLQNLLVTLRPRTELVIDRMCYCEWFKAFGVYQPLPDGHAFVARSGGRPGEMVCVYAELRNVASVRRGNFFETRLSSAIELRDAKGQVVKVIDFKDHREPQRTLSRLNDHCNMLSFEVPPLPAGTYQLVLRVADETNPGSRRVAQKSMEFRVSPIGGVARHPSLAPQ